LSKGLVLLDEEGNEGFIPIVYRDLPEICNLCRQRGHLPCTCPKCSTSQARAPTSVHTPPRAKSPILEYLQGDGGFQPARNNAGRPNKGKNRGRSRTRRAGYSRGAPDAAVDPNQAGESNDLQSEEEAAIKLAYMGSPIRNDSNPTAMNGQDPGVNHEDSSEGSMPSLEPISPRLNEFENLVYPGGEESNETQLLEEDNPLAEAPQVESELQEPPGEVELVDSILPSQEQVHQVQDADSPTG
jgi:hypothetical protein